MYKLSVYPHSENSWVECFTAMTLKFILISNLLIVSAYNLDINYPILYPHSATNADQYLYTKFERSYFGYVVLLNRDLQKNTSWLLIGAPRGNYTRPLLEPLKLLDEPGVVYRCNLPGLCVEIEPDFIGQAYYVRQLGRRVDIRKRHSWFGSAMSVERNSGFFTACAPRMMMRINNSRRGAYMDTMQGMCYSGQMSSTTLKAELSEIAHFDYSKSTWFDPIHGFSVAFAAPQNVSGAISRVVGRPNDNITGSIDITRFRKHTLYEINRETTDIPIYDDLSQLGYAVTSGYYFNRNQSLYACADPGWNSEGQVAIIDLDGNFITYLRGSSIGESFGASLASGDLNNDGLHDLVVGAPHWGNDNGRVHVYLGSPRNEFEAATILEGASEDALFGYAVAIGDVDGNGFNDIIVGAPWEESGAIYIYNGDASLKDKIRPTVSQRITMQLFGPNLPVKGVDIQTFGFSISEPIDIDDNGYADIAVGAYKSGHVVVFRSKPVVRTTLTVHTVPTALQRNVSNFLIEACVQYNDYDTADTHAFKVSLIVDKKYKRTKETSLEMFSMHPPVHTCVNATITLSDNIQNFIEPIAIHASHDFTHNDSSASEFCKTCPVENRNHKSNSAQILLPFDIGCGDDRVCNSNISATVKLSGVRENNTWVIGSNDITLETHLRNYAEPAYLTTVVYVLSKGIVLRSILPFCEEDADGDILIIICNIGNPFGTDEQKVVKLDLDMRRLTDGSLHGQVLDFSMEIRTHSVNHGTRMIKSPLTLQSEASLLLNGKAIEESYYLFDLDNDKSNIIFQHVYQILKLGATPVEEARLVVNVPTAIDDSDPLVLLYKPRVYISGEYYNCLSKGIDLVNVQRDGLPEGTALDAPDLYNLSYNNDTLRNVRHNVFKRDINSHAAIATRVLQTLYNMRTARSEDPDGKLRARERNIAYANCSTYGVNCSTVYCDLSALRTRQDIGKLVIRLILNTTKFKDNFKLPDETKIVKFSTDAYVEIIKPANRIVGVDIRRDMNVTTEFRSTAKAQKLQLWVVLVSVSLGLILLCIVIIILSMVGFFNRMTKEKLSALKFDELTEDVEEIINTSE